MDYTETYFIFEEVIHIISPLIVLLGAMIIFYKDHAKMEEILNKEIGGIKVRVFPMIETNILKLHNQLLKIRNIIGALCMLTGIYLLVFIR